MSQAPPLIANAMVRLVHSPRLGDAARARGVWRMTTQMTNIAPSNDAASRARTHDRRDRPAAMNATPVISAQASGAGIHEGMTLAT